VPRPVTFAPRLDFAPGAVTRTTTLTLTPILATDGMDLAFAGHAFDLVAVRDGVAVNGLAFGAPVSATIRYSDLDVWSIADEEKLAH